MDIAESLRIIRRHSNSWRTLEDHLLDMRAITSLARVVGLQSAQLRFQSSSMYMDPGLLKQKIQSYTREQLAEFLLLSWHPIIELEQLTLASTKDALEYWNELLSFFERRKRLQLGPYDLPSPLDSSELSRMRILEEKAFTKKLEEFWRELKGKTEGKGKIEYWAFVGTPTFAQTVQRAQMVSFLVSYGMATLERKREKMFLTPKESPFTSKMGSPLSLPIPIPRGVAY